MTDDASPCTTTRTCSIARSETGGGSLPTVPDFILERAKFVKNWATFDKFLANYRKNVLLEECKGMHCVDLGESFPTIIYLQKSASIQPRTSPSKFGGKYSILFNYVLSRDQAFK